MALNKKKYIKKIKMNFHSKEWLRKLLSVMAISINCKSSSLKMEGKNPSPVWFTSPVLFCEF